MELYTRQEGRVIVHEGGEVVLMSTLVTQQDVDSGIHTVTCKCLMQTAQGSTLVVARAVLEKKLVELIQRLRVSHELEDVLNHHPWKREGVCGRRADAMMRGAQVGGDLVVRVAP